LFKLSFCSLHCSSPSTPTKFSSSVLHRSFAKKAVVTVDDGVVVSVVDPEDVAVDVIEDVAVDVCVVTCVRDSVVVALVVTEDVGDVV